MRKKLSVPGQGRREVRIAGKDAFEYLLRVVLAAEHRAGASELAKELRMVWRELQSAAKMPFRRGRVVVLDQRVGHAAAKRRVVRLAGHRARQHLDRVA